MPAQEAAAEAVVPLVDIGAHELGDQVAVGAVQFDAVEAGLLDAPRAFGELLDQLVDLLDRHGPDRLAPGQLLGVHDFVAGRAGMSITWSLADSRFLRGQAAWRPGAGSVRRTGAVAVHGLGQFGQPGISGSSSTHTHVTVGRPVLCPGTRRRR
jgi:hypothetical protein